MSSSRVSSIYGNQDERKNQLLNALLNKVKPPKSNNRAGEKDSYTTTSTVNRNTTTNRGTSTKIYDNNGRVQEGYVNNGVSYLADGSRPPSGYTVQTGGGIYRMGSDGRGTKVSEHNQPVYKPAPQINHIPYPVERNIPGMVDLDWRSAVYDRGNTIKTSVRNNPNINYDIDPSLYDYNPRGGAKGPKEVYNIHERSLHSLEDINNAVRPDHYKVGGQYGYSDYNAMPSNPEEYDRMVLRTPDGYYTTVDRLSADYYADQGFELLAPARGGYAWDIKEAIRNDKAGEEWKDDGFNSGNVMLRKYNDDGTYRTSTTNARYGEKKFDEGWELSPKSQSLYRALQSGKHTMNDAINQTIKDGKYNSDYSGHYDNHGYVDRENTRADGTTWMGKDYKFDGDGRGSYNSYGTGGKGNSLINAMMGNDKMGPPDPSKEVKKSNTVENQGSSSKSVIIYDIDGNKLNGKMIDGKPHLPDGTPLPNGYGTEQNSADYSEYDDGNYEDFGDYDVDTLMELLEMMMGW